MTETPHRHLGQEPECYNSECPRLTTKDWGTFAAAAVGFVVLAGVVSALAG